jgi:NAD(P)-dependent dehydrogenase (short-subunit alcohol dehydrogenase family)
MTDEFIRLGHRVTGCARSATVIEALEAKYAAPHQFASIDVCDDTQVGSWSERVLQSGHPPDLLINNAAMINENAPLWDVPPAEYSRIVDVNLKGPYYVIRHFLPAMIQRGSGVVVNLSSTWGRSTSPEVATYCATKWAIEGLTRALADELPASMAAVPLNPGIIHTEMLETCFGSHAAAYPTPESWAKKAVPFLLGLGPEDNGKPLTAPS